MGRLARGALTWDTNLRHPTVANLQLVYRRPTAEIIKPLVGREANRLWALRKRRNLSRTALIHRGPGIKRTLLAKGPGRPSDMPAVLRVGGAWTGIGKS